MISFSKLINTVDIGISIIDRNLKIVLWNSWLEKRTGKCKKEVIGKKITDVYPLFSKRVYQQYFCNMFSKQNNIVFLSGVIHPDLFNINFLEKEYRYNVMLQLFNENKKDYILIQVNDVTLHTNQIKYLKQEILRRKLTTKELELKNIELDKLYNKLDGQIAKARTIHEKVLQKKLPVIDGISLAAYYNPALNLGGDFYNVMKKEDKLLIYLSDVTGHGLDSVLLSSFIKNTIDSYMDLVLTKDVCPKKLATFLQHRISQEDFPNDYAVSIFISVIDLTKNIMKYTSAGVHTPPFIIEYKEELITLENNGLPISNSLDNHLMDFKEKEIILKPNVKVFFSTDGLYEQNKDKLLYYDQVKSLIVDNRNLPCGILADLINTDFHNFIGDTEQKDDLTFLILHVGEDKLNQLIFSSTIESIEEVIAIFREKLPDTYHTFNFLTGLIELLINAIEHGNDFNPDKEVIIKYFFSETHLIATVMDEGKGFNWQRAIRKEMDLSGESERGRGITIARMFSDHLIFNAKGNRVSMIMYNDKF